MDTIPALRHGERSLLRHHPLPPRGACERDSAEPLVSVAMLALFAAHSANDDSSKAIRVGEDALPLARRVFGPTDERTLGLLKSLVKLYRLMDDEETARKHEAELNSSRAPASR